MFSDLLSPVTTKEFFENYFEKKFLHISRNDSTYFKEILTYELLDEMLHSINLFHPENRIVDNATETFPDPKTYTIKGSSRIDPLKFVRYYSQGSTLVFSGAQERLYNLRKLTNTVGAYFRHPFQTNIYLTPSNSQGFSPHYDSHDVFILQFAGEKVWRIYDSNVELADKSMMFEKGVSKIGNVTHEFTLKQGDTLYIPRGVMHDANCEGSDSGHITLGLVGNNWAEHLASIILNEKKSSPTLRKHPLFGHEFGTSKEDLIKIKEIVNGLIDSLESNPDFIDDYLSKEKSLSKGNLLQAIRKPSVDGSTKVRLREKHQIRTKIQDEELTIMFYDIKVNLPAYSASFLDFLLKNDGAVSVSEIDCDLDEESMVFVCEELANQGLMELL